MHSRRIIESALGQKIALDILPGSDGIRLSRPECPDGEAVVLDSRAAQILVAYLARVLVIKTPENHFEEVDDGYDTVMRFHVSPAPRVTITQRHGALDVHAPLWEALRCEIDLVAPRLQGSQRNSAPTRH